VWAFLLLENQETATFTLNRIAMALFFTALTLILFSWIQVLSAEFSMQTGFLPGLKVAFIISNVALYIILIISFSLYIANRKNGDDWEGNTFYEANVLVIAVINFVAVFIFLLFGARLYFRLRSEQQFAGAAFRLTLVAFVMVACFVCRVVFFAWRPATGQFMPEPLFYSMGYLLPEIVPISTQFYLFFRRMQLSAVKTYARMEDDRSAGTTVKSTELSSAKSTRQPALVHVADVHYEDDEEEGGDFESGSNLSFYEMLREGPPKPGSGK